MRYDDRPIAHNNAADADKDVNRAKIEYGDFQTPDVLAKQICQRICGGGFRPRTIVEPTCGQGALLLAAADMFSHAKRVIGLDINRNHLESLQSQLKNRSGQERFEIRCQNIFDLDWDEFFDRLPEPLLIIGNPPWVTSAALGALGSSNLPEKYNVERRQGLDAITGRSNFDISEWIIRKLFIALSGRRAKLAMLCKLSVARKALAAAWKGGAEFYSSIHSIDSIKHFQAAVDACLLVCDFGKSRGATTTPVYPDLQSTESDCRIAWRSSRLVANEQFHDRWRHLGADGESRSSQQAKYVWRSGIKHDCAKVFELSGPSGSLRNGFDESVDIEPRHLYPLLKSSDIARGSAAFKQRWLLLPQTRLNEDTSRLAHRSPRTWDYLLSHSELLDGRRSSIYRHRPRFAIFGIGEYSFAPWKVVISGFYKRLSFSVAGPLERRPMLLDDTCYFLSCRSRREATAIAGALNSDVAREFFSGFIFWDAKRPITAEVLNRMDISKLMVELVTHTG